jgi:hypothetical protein
MTTDEPGVPVFSSPRAALVAFRADVVQAISRYELALDLVVDPFAPELVGPAIAAMTAEAQKTLPHRRHREVRRLVIAANREWATEAKFYHWMRQQLATGR